MGSRYLLVEFDNEADALKLKEMLDERSRVGRPLRVIGLFAKPTNYCQCGVDKWTTTKSSPATTRRGRRFGWWVCTECKRPAASISGLVNLVSPDDIINPPAFDLKNGVGELIFHVLSLSAVSRKKPRER